MWHDNLSNDDKGWILTIASSLTCVLGSLAIYGDVIYNKLSKNGSKFSFKDNNVALNISLSISSGILIFTSLYKLLPEALDYYQSAPWISLSPKRTNFILITSYILGALICTLFNDLIHALTSQSIVHCSHEGLSCDTQPEHHHSDHHHRHSEVEEHENDMHSGPRTPSFIDFTGRLRGKKSLGVCMGYSTINECSLGRRKSVSPSNNADESRASLLGSQTPQSYHSVVDDDDSISEEQDDTSSVFSNDDDDHHHHVLTKYSHLFTIGVQTAVAITVHKVPEGFLMFATSHASPELGLNVFLALAVHNLCEGFTLAFPLYLALENRLKAVAIASILGGLSQPLGGLLAWTLFHKDLDESSSALVFGLLVAITAGFMSIIGLQMFGTAVTFRGDIASSLRWSFTGMAVIGLTTCLTA